MKQFIKNIFNIPEIKDVIITEKQLAELLKEPLQPETKMVLDWYSRNILAND